MDGTETGWSRPAEPAPRWRALLDRARLGGRNGEQADPAGRRVDDESYGGADQPSGRRSGGNGFQGRATIGPPDDPDYLADLRRSYGPADDRRPAGGPDRYGDGRRIPDQRDPGANRSDQPRGGQPGYPAEYRYAEPDPSGYPTESRYAALESDYRGPGGYPTESRYSVLEPGYSAPVARHGYPAPDAGYSRRPGTPPGGPATRRWILAMRPHRDPSRRHPSRRHLPRRRPSRRRLSPPPLPRRRPRSRRPLARPAVGGAGRPGRRRPGGLRPGHVGRGNGVRAGGDSGYGSPPGWRRGRTESETERAIGVLRRGSVVPGWSPSPTPRAACTRPPRPCSPRPPSAASAAGGDRLGRQRAARHARTARRQRPARPDHPAPDHRSRRDRVQAGAA